MGWGGMGMFTFLALAHMVDALAMFTFLAFAHIMGLDWGGVGWGCYRSLYLHTCSMLRNMWVGLNLEEMRWELATALEGKWLTFMGMLVMFDLGILRNINRCPCHNLHVFPMTLTPDNVAMFSLTWVK